MPIKLDASAIENPQQMEVAVAGPDGANRMFITTGIIQANLAAQKTWKDTYTFLVGPVLTKKQFHSAIATASLANIRLVLIQAPSGYLQWSVTSVDADWDDESGQVEVRLELLVEAEPPGIWEVYVYSLGYQATILAEI